MLSPRFLFALIPLFTASIFAEAAPNRPLLEKNASEGEKEKNEEARRDTASAVVVYNAETWFIPSTKYDVNYYNHLIDSLVRLDVIPVNLVNQLNVYRNLSKYERNQLLNVVDSIFESDNVPRSVVNAVNIYLSSIEEERNTPKGFYAFVPASRSTRPAGAFYTDWNTDVPYPTRNNLSKFDSTLTLLLVDKDQDCGYAIPREGVLTSHFGWRWGRNHNGTDLDLEVWDPVVAAFPGVVRVARNYKGYGRVVVIRHYNGLETLYAHLHRFKVKTGDAVEAGDVIGLGGSSGASTGSHLHFEVRFQGVPINPASIFNFRTGTLRQEHVVLERSGAVLAVVPENRKPQGQAKNEMLASASKAGSWYEVKKGDYLYKIAREQGLSVEYICAANKLSPNKPLYVGQKLRLGSE